MPSRSRLLFCTACIATSTVLEAQHPGPVPAIARAARRVSPIRIDGRLDEPAWAEAEANDGFVQSYPKSGAPASDRTEFRVLYDDDALIVGVRAFDSRPDSITAQLARRDPVGIYSDWIHVIVDSYHDRRTAFAFSVNPRGVKRDALEFNDNSEDANWDAVWEVATSTDSLGWSAEFRIPFSQLRFGGATLTAERTWGLEVFRDVARRNERDAWAPWNPQDGALVSRFGDVVGLVGVRSSAHTELMPYASSKLTRAPGEPGNPFFRANAMKPSIGTDFKVALPRGLTLTGAINPDFGQVEVDPAVVNLSAYETFFPEKRPFFIEGAGIFGFGKTRTYNNYEFQQYFYSRRIGKQPTKTIDAPYVDAPDATTIAAATKLSGKVGPWTIGLLDAVTPRETARFRLATNELTQSSAVEPLTNYFVGRVRRDFDDGHTVIGGMLSATHRALGDTALGGLLRDRATFGGIDFERGWNAGKWYLTGYVAGSQVAGTSTVIAATQRSSVRYYQRPDATYLRYDPTRDRIDGATGEIALQRSGSFAASLSYKTVTPGFEINDLGFLGRSDYHAISSLIGYQSYTAGRLFRTHSEVLYGNQTWNYGRDLIYNTVGVSAYGFFTNFWSGNVGGNFAPAVLNDRLTRGGPLALSPASTNLNASIGSDYRRPFAARLALAGGWDSFDGRLLSPSLSLTVRPTSYVSVTFGPTLTNQTVGNQYVQTTADPAATETYANRYVFGRLRQTTLSGDTRVDWTFTPQLSLQMYAQPFVSAGKYSGFMELARRASLDYARYGQTRGSISYDPTTAAYTVDPDGSGPATAFSIENPDFNVRSLRGNAVLRWEYRPGSTVYFVWQQQRSGSATTGEFDFNRDVQAIFREPVTNVFLVKLTFWAGR